MMYSPSFIPREVLIPAHIRKVADPLVRRARIFNVERDYRNATIDCLLKNGLEGFVIKDWHSDPIGTCRDGLVENGMKLSRLFSFVDRYSVFTSGYLSLNVFIEVVNQFMFGSLEPMWETTNR
ncbi:MAG TPA: hypothetical protein VIT23_02025 [Terrimicrobiaceae bacterium]